MPLNRIYYIWPVKKTALAIIFLCCFQQIKAQPIFSEKGYPEHFIAGTIIGGVTSYFVYKKTDNKFKAWVAGTLTAAAVGFLKEAIDPSLLSGVSNTTDAFYTSLGGAVGAGIVVPLKRRERKKTPNITAAFK